MKTEKWSERASQSATQNANIEQCDFYWATNAINEPEWLAEAENNKIYTIFIQLS